MNRLKSPRDGTKHREVSRIPQINIVLVLFKIRLKEIDPRMATERGILSLGNGKSAYITMRPSRAVHYANGEKVKTIAEVQTAVDEGKVIIKFDKQTGQRRCLDYEQCLWLRVEPKKEEQ